MVSPRHRVPHVPDVRRLVGVDAGVLDDDLVAFGRARLSLLLLHSLPKTPPDQKTRSNIRRQRLRRAKSLPLEASSAAISCAICRGAFFSRFANSKQTGEAASPIASFGGRSKAIVSSTPYFSRMCRASASRNRFISVRYKRPQFFECFSCPGGESINPALGLANIGETATNGGSVISSYHVTAFYRHRLADSSSLQRTRSESMRRAMQLQSQAPPSLIGALPDPWRAHARRGKIERSPAHRTREVSPGPKLRDAIIATFDAKDLKEGTAWAGQGPDFFFATQAAAKPELFIDGATGPTDAPTRRLGHLVRHRSYRAAWKTPRLLLHS